MVPRRLVHAACALSLSLPLAAADPGRPLVVAVENVRSSSGRILVAVCTRAEYPGPCAWAGEAPAHAGTTLVTVRDLPPGSYAALAFHDLNGNRRLDRMMGIPREGYGFSRATRRPFGPPAFEASRFDHGTAEQRIAFRLYYLW